MGEYVSRGGLLALWVRVTAARYTVATSVGGRRSPSPRMPLSSPKTVVSCVQSHKGKVPNLVGAVAGE